VLKRVIPVFGALVLLVAFSGIAMAASSDPVSGTIANTGSWALYGTKHSTTVSYYGPYISVATWSGTDQYYYVRKCDSDDPIGAGTPNSPVQAKVNDNGWKQLGPLPQGYCFRMSARKDWSWFSGSAWWTGTLLY
jgi:hypothetical protein